MRRLTRTCIAIVLIACSHGVFGSDTPAPLNEPQDRRIIVIGDLHGDMAQTLAVMRSTNLVSVQPEYYSDRAKNMGMEMAMRWITTGQGTRKDSIPLDRNHVNRNMVFNKRGMLMNGSRGDVYHWSGDSSTLVLVGDAMNVGPDDIDIVYFLMRLSEEAEEKGGKIVYLLGNHELQNLQGDYMGVHPWSFERSGGRDGRTVALSMKTPLGRYLRSRPVLYEDNGLIFMHGGMIPATVKALKHLLPDVPRDKLIRAVNRHTRKGLEGWKSDAEGDPAGPTRDKVASFIMDYHYGDNDTSPILVHPLDKCDGVIEANRMLGIATQVVGHTPHDPPLYSFCDGNLLAVDFHISKWKAGQGAAYAALQLIYAPRLHNHTNGPEQGENVWHSSLVIPSRDILEEGYGEPFNEARRIYNWKTFVAAVAVTVLAVELCLHYIWRRNSRPKA